MNSYFSVFILWDTHTPPDANRDPTVVGYTTLILRYIRKSTLYRHLAPTTHQLPI